MTKQKKPKTGDVVGWAVVNRFAGVVSGTYRSRNQARLSLSQSQSDGSFKPYRIAKIVLAK